MDNLNIPIILGASRPDNQSRKVANLVFNISKEYPEIETRLIDVKDFKIDYDEDKSIPEFHAIVENADAFFLVFPEYNHHLPGKLKTLLDTEFDSYKYKPLATASVSSGEIGGVRAVEAAIPFFVVLGLIVTGINVRFPNVENAFHENGSPLDVSQTNKVRDAFKKLIYITKIMKKGKEIIK